MIPFDSIVDESYVELGIIWRTEVAKIVDLNPLHVNLSQMKKTLSKITLNQNVDVIIGSKVLTGKVNFISWTTSKETREF